MNDFEQLDLALQKRIDQVCDDYESGLMNGLATPTLEASLVGVAGGCARRILFSQLLAIDLEHCATRDRPSRLTELRLRFPLFSDVVDQVASLSMSQRNPATDETVATGSETTPSQYGGGELPLDSKIFGQYELIERVGSGAFGHVWKAHDSALGRTVAIKLPRVESVSDTELQRFRKEAQLTAKLNHPNIVGVHEIGKTRQTPFIVSDFVDGRSISDWKEQAGATTADITRLCIRIADALDHAHEVGIVHRDLKPTNVLVDENNEPHIADFGLAKSLADETMTIEGNLLGSPAYMSPEQALGDAYKADRRSDVYSLGVILYELLVGERPFRGSPESVLHQVIHSEPVPLRTLDPKVSADLDTICIKCLSKDPQQRYQTARLLSDDLRRFEKGAPILARSVTQVERIWRWSKRNPAFATAVGLATSLLVLLAIAGPWLAIRETKRTEAANQLATKRELERKEAQRQSSLRALSAISSRFTKSGAAAALPMIQSELKNGDAEIVDGFPFRHLHHQVTNIGRRTYSTTVEFLAVSPVDEYAVFGVERKQVVLWDLDANKEVRRFDFHGATAFSADGTQLAIGEKEIRIFDVATGKEIRRYDLHEWYSHGELTAGTEIDPKGGISKLSWSANKKWIAYTNWENPHVRVLHVDTGKTLIIGKGFNHDQQKIVSVAFSPTSDELATGGFDGSVKLWSIETGKLNRTFMVPNEWAREVTYSHDGSMLAYTDDHNVYVRDLSTNDYVTVLAFDAAFSLAFSPDDSYIASGSWSNVVKVWNISLPMDNFILRGHTSTVRSTVFSTGGRLLTRETKSNDVIDWGKLSELSNRIVQHSQEIKSISISPDQRYVAAVGDDAIVSITEIDSRNRIAAFSSLRKDLNLSFPQRVAVDFDPTAGRLTLAAIAYQEVLIWTGVEDDLRRLKPPFESDESNLWSIQYSHDGKFLVSGDSDGTLWYWDTTTWNVQRWEYTDGGIDEITFGSDGRMAITHNSPDEGGKQISCLTLADRNVVFGPVDARSSHSVDLDFDPEGELLASSSRQGVVNLWNTETGRHIRALDPGGMYVLSVAFTPDGKYLANATGKIKLWDLQDMVEAVALDIDLVPTYALEFAKDGSFMLSAGHDNAVRIWKAPHLKRSRTL